MVRGSHRAIRFCLIDEQLRRFKEREQISYKQFKITEEDYRNRDQWDAYSLAVNDMVARTSTQAVPWILVL
jgi:polyphosphate kinase 2 (PPK2 family)